MFRMRCLECGRTFLSAKIDRRYCSKACVEAAVGHQRKCVHCGKLFSPVTAKEIFCSSQCRHAAARELYLKRKKAKKERERRENAMHWTCQHCGRSYVPTKMNQKYCSGDCAYQATLDRHRAYRKARRARNKPGVIVLSICAVCGEPFDPKAVDARGDCCSERCELRAKERADRASERERREKLKKKWPPVYGCLYCGEVMQTPDGKPPRACRACGSKDVVQLRRCHDCGAVVPDASYRCPECNEKRRRCADKFDAGADGYEVAL